MLYYFSKFNSILYSIHYKYETKEQNSIITAQFDSCFSN